MEIRLIRTEKTKLDTLCRNGKVLEVSYSPDGEAVLDMYDPVTSSVECVSPDIKKNESIPVFNCIWNSSDVFFATLSNDTENTFITVYRYLSDRSRSDTVLKLTGNYIPDDANKMIRLFVLTEDTVIVQTEHKKDQNIERLMGNIEFSQTLINVVTKEHTEVKDLNLINNGINMIIPVSPTHIMLKTGFSSIEDTRIDIDSEAEALIESVYFGSMAMFISSAFRDNTTISYKLLGTAYFDKSIISPAVQDDFIFFTVFDHSKMSSEIIFYNFVNDETYRCLVEEANRDDLSVAYVIDNTPYVRTVYPDKTEFFNVLTSEADRIFYNERFITVTGNLFIFSVIERGKRKIRIYRSHGSNFVLEEKGRYVSSCHEQDNYFIYISNK